MILNSLDAGATIIDIKLDFHQMSIEVTDNGCGIPIELLISLQEYQWNHTTKEINTSNIGTKSNSKSNSNYGCKGEALAAIRSLCHIRIDTRHVDSDLVYRSVLDDTNTPMVTKRDQHTNSSSMSAPGSGPGSRPDPGSIVYVYDIFHSIPVRRKHIKKLTEIQAITKFIQYISLLFYNVQFNVLEVDSSRSNGINGNGTNDNAMGNSRGGGIDIGSASKNTSNNRKRSSNGVLVNDIHNYINTSTNTHIHMQMPVVESVASRVIALHGACSLSKMQVSV